PKSTGKKIRGVVYRRGSWWCRWFENGRERVEACDSKTQAMIRYGWHKAQVREHKFFPEKFAVKDLTLRAWLARCLEGSTNRGIQNEQLYSRRLSLGPLGKKLLTAITLEDVKRLQVAMRAKLKPQSPRENVPSVRMWSDATVSRHLSYLRHVIALAMECEDSTR